MFKAFSLNEPLDPNFFLSEVDKLMTATRELPDRILVVRIETVSQEATMLPLLENKVENKDN